VGIIGVGKNQRLDGKPRTGGGMIRPGRRLLSTLAPGELEQKQADCHLRVQAYRCDCERSRRAGLEDFICRWTQALMLARAVIPAIGLGNEQPAKAAPGRE